VWQELSAALAVMNQTPTERDVSKMVQLVDQSKDGKVVAGHQSLVLRDLRLMVALSQISYEEFRDCMMLLDPIEAPAKPSRTLTYSST
jgi:hypothetical protein